MGVNSYQSGDGGTFTNNERQLIRNAKYESQKKGNNLHLPKRGQAASATPEHFKLPNKYLSESVDLITKNIIEGDKLFTNLASDEYVQNQFKAHLKNMEMVYNK